jgi:hypothetical protein
MPAHRRLESIHCQLAGAATVARRPAAGLAGRADCPTITNVKAIKTAPYGTRLVVVKVETSEPGLHGVGCATFTQRPTTVCAAIEDYLCPFLIGRRVSEIEDIWQSSYVSSYWRLGWGSVALSRCTAAHPLHIRFTNIIGASLSEATMRPNPRSGPVLNNKEWGRPGPLGHQGQDGWHAGARAAWRQGADGLPGLRRARSLWAAAHPFHTIFTMRFGTSISDATMRPNPT